MTTHPLEGRGLYVPLDVNFADDPKILRAGIEAELLYVRSLAFAKRIGSDGRIAREHLWKLAGDMPSVAQNGDDPMLIAKQLAESGLWVELADGWQIVAWERWNLTASEIEERRQGKARGGALGNHRRWHEGRDVVDEDCEYCLSDGLSDSESVDQSDSESTKTETETKSEREGAIAIASDAPPPKKKPSTTRGTRIPQPFDVSDAMVDWVVRECPGIDWDRETKKFVNHFAGSAGQRGVKLDWVATWRKWMLNATDRYAR